MDPRAAFRTEKGSSNAGFFAINFAPHSFHSQLSKNHHPGPCENSENFFLQKKIFCQQKITWVLKKKWEKQNHQNLQRLELSRTTSPVSSSFHAPKFTEDRIINPSGAKCCMELSQMPSLLEGESSIW